MALPQEVTVEIQEISIFWAFLAGLLTFFSPCVLPLVPVYLGFLSGKNLNQHVDRKAVFLHALFFVLGFSLVFIVLGSSVGLLGSMLVDRLPLLQKIAGIFLVILGIHLIGIIKIPFLYQEKRFRFNASAKKSYFASCLVGISFSLGWTPCVGPILGGILVLAYASQTALQGSILLTVFALGLGIPFLITALALGQISNLLRRFNKYYRLVEIIGGLFLISIGVFIFFDFLTTLNSYFDFLGLGTGF